MEREGVTLTTTLQLVAELAQNWTTPEGAQLVQIVFKVYSFDTISVEVETKIAPAVMFNISACSNILNNLFP